ncbi:hypothetical protein ACFLUF_02255 [Chloroflexota bacterium]
MAKLTPRDRWLGYLKERIKVLKLSGKIEPLRVKGLAVLYRKKLYTNEEWWQSFSQRAKSPEYLKWYEECEALSRKVGLAPWIVVMMCLLEDYDPEKDMGFMVIERDWPRIRVITESTNSLFLRRLSYEARQLGLYAMQRVGGIETTLINIDDSAIDGTSGPNLILDESNGSDAFNIRVETPMGYPPEAAGQLQKEATQLAHQLTERMGFRIPKRLRTSKLVTMSEVLEVEKGTLPRGAIYDIVDKVYPDGDLSKDQQRRKLTASRRHRARKRLLRSQ